MENSLDKFGKVGYAFGIITPAEERTDSPPTEGRLDEIGNLSDIAVGAQIFGHVSPERRYPCPPDPFVAFLI